MMWGANRCRYQDASVQPSDSEDKAAGDEEGGEERNCPEPSTKVKRLTC